MISTDCSELVDEVLEGGDASAETLSQSDLFDELEGLGAFLHGVGSHLLPMIEDTLREGTAGGGGTESLGESEGLGDGKEGLHDDERGSWDGVLSVDNTSPLGQALVDSTNGVIGALDLDEEDGFAETGLGGEHASVEDTSSGGHNLATTSVDSIGVKGNILDVEADSTHVFVSHDTLFGGPLEGSLHGVTDFVKVLNLLGGINEQVSTSGLWAETPDLLGIVGIPVVIVLKKFGTLLEILLGGDFVGLDGFGEFVTDRASNSEDSVMLVR